MYQALYRKWRPRTFDEVVGQDHITDILKKQVLTDRPSHAYLFTGTRGTGKTTCAKLLAKAVNCLNPVGGNPCNECEICRGIDSGSILDVTEMDAASNNGVDDVRAIRDEAVYAPVAARRRVYIVDEVHMLSKPAFNALLKLMEEPPEHLIFILATTELYKVPATILSRCQRYSFHRVPPSLIKARLRQVAEAEGLELEEEAADLLSRLADGALRDALSLLDQCSGARVDRERVLSAIGLAAAFWRPYTGGTAIPPSAFWTACISPGRMWPPYWTSSAPCIGTCSCASWRPARGAFSCPAGIPTPYWTGSAGIRTPPAFWRPWMPWSRAAPPWTGPATGVSARSCVWCASAV